MKKLITLLFSMFALTFSLSAQSLFTPLFTAPGNSQFTQSSFPNTATGYVLTKNSVLYKTTDGGSSWNTVYTFTGTQNNSWGLKFTDDLTGYLSLDDAGYKTTDGGATWATTGDNLGKMFVFDENNVFNLSTHSLSTNSGTSFANLNDFSSPLSFMNYQHNVGGFFAGIATSNNNVYATIYTNSLNLWFQLGSFPGSALYYDFVNTSTGFCNAGNKVYSTVNSGYSWQEVGSSFINGKFMTLRIKALSDQKFFINLISLQAPYTASGTYFSNDGGNSYLKTQLASTQTVSIGGSDFFTEDLGYFITDKVIYKYENAPYISAYPTGLSFTGIGGTQTLQVVSNTNWLITTTGSNISFNPSNGTGSEVITVTCAPNYSGSSIQSEYGIEGSGAWSGNFPITQSSTTTVAGLSVSPLNLSFTGFGGDKTIAITTTEPWYIINTGDFIASPSSGLGNFVVTITALPNYTVNPINQNFIVSIAGIMTVVGITQESTFAGENLSLSGTYLPFLAEGEATIINVFSNIAWNVSTVTIPGITVSPMSGTGNGVITVTAAPNYLNQTIAGYIGVSGGSLPNILIYVFQGGSATGSNLSISQNYFDLGPKSFTTSIDVTSNPANWSVTGIPNWIEVSPPVSSGTSFTLSVSPNFSTASRYVYLDVTNGFQSKQIFISQDVLTITNSFLNFPALGGSQIVYISSNLSWTVDPSTIPGISISPMSGTGDGVVTVTAAPNALNQTIIGWLTLYDAGLQQQVITYYQDASVTGLGLTVSQNNIYISPGTFSTVINVTSNPAEWTITGVPSWMTVSPSVSTGSSFTLSVSPNFDGSDRALNIEVSNGAETLPITVSQSALEVSNQYLNFTDQGENIPVNITTNGAWNVQSITVPGISISPLSGTGDGVITVTAAPNYSNLSISGQVFLNTVGQTYLLFTRQAGTTPGLSLSISPSSFSVSSIAGTYTFTITSNLSRWWFISIDGVGYLSATTGFDNSTVDLYLPTNTTTSPITIHATVYGYGTGETQTATITQAAGYPASAPPSYLTVSGNNIEISADGDVQVFQIYSDAYWNITSDDTWYTISTLAGMGNAVVSITGSANSSIFPRGGILHINSSGHTPIAVNIVQDGQTPFITQDSTLTFFTNSPVLYWTTVPGASTYCIQIATDSLFANPLVSICNISSLQYMVPPGVLSSAGGNFFRGEQINGQYYWRVAAVSNGIVGSYSEPQKFKIEQILAIDGTLTNKVITVNPNPSTGTFHISGYLGNVQLINAQGNVVLESIVTENNHLIATTDLPKGIYLLKAGSTIKKLIFE